MVVALRRQTVGPIQALATAPQFARRWIDRLTQVASITIFPPLSSCARHPGAITQVASYSSIIVGPWHGLDRSERRITGVCTQPVCFPKYARRAGGGDGSARLACMRFGTAASVRTPCPTT